MMVLKNTRPKGGEPPLPTFSEVAERIFEILHNKIWLGHRVTSFQQKVVEKAFQRIGRQHPESQVMIDTKVLIEDQLKHLDLPDFELTTLADFYGIRSGGHKSYARTGRRALEDAELNL